MYKVHGPCLPSAAAFIMDVSIILPYWNTICDSHRNSIVPLLIFTSFVWFGCMCYALAKQIVCNCIQECERTDKGTSLSNHHTLPFVNRPPMWLDITSVSRAYSHIVSVARGKHKIGPNVKHTSSLGSHIITTGNLPPPLAREGGGGGGGR